MDGTCLLYCVLVDSPGAAATEGGTPARERKMRLPDDHNGEALARNENARFNLTLVPEAKGL